MARKRISEHEWLYRGVVHEQAATIRRDGLLVAPTPYVFLRRLELRGQESDAAQEFNSIVHTSDAFVYSHTGAFTLVRDFWNRYELREIGTFGKNDFSFYLNQGAYQEIDRDGLSVSFSRDEYLLNQDIPLPQVLGHGVLQAAMRNSRVTNPVYQWSPLLLEQYGERVVFPRFEQAMGVYVLETPERDEVWAAGVNRFVNWSQLDGRCSLDGGCRRLVGVAPEALEAARRRSFELCERLSGEAYPALARERRIGEGRLEAGQRGARQGATGGAVNETATQNVKTVSYYQFDAPIPLELFTDAEREEQQKARKEAQKTQETQWTRSFEINRGMKKGPE